MPTLLSLFDGSGGFPLAGALCGITPKYASEVEPYPIAVTRSRFPDMIHLGDVSRVHGNEIDPVDVVTFGLSLIHILLVPSREILQISSGQVTVIFQVAARPGCSDCSTGIISARCSRS